jgi:hypothetical protein
MPRKAAKMKSLFTALVLTSLAGPVLALNLPTVASSVTTSETEDFGRRSGRCAYRPVQAATISQIVTREGSACGGV